MPCYSANCLAPAITGCLGSWHLTLALFLVCVCRFETDSSCSEPVLHVRSLAHVAYAFVNGTYAGMLLVF